MPVNYVHGTENRMFLKIEEALAGCQPGDSVQLAVTSEESYGDICDELIYTDNINNVPEQYREIGALVEFKSDQGEAREFRVAKIENGMLMLDGNHPLAGKQLTFSIDIVSVRDATEGEIKQGHTLDTSIPIH